MKLIGDKFYAVVATGDKKGDPFKVVYTKSASKDARQSRWSNGTGESYPATFQTKEAGEKYIRCIADGDTRFEARDF